LCAQVRDAARLSHYSFGTRTASFLVCRTCGTVPIVTSRISGRDYPVVNVNCFEDIAANRLEHSAVAFDDEDETARLARRAAGWIGDVQINGLG
jgi:hypothetical protein